MIHICQLILWGLIYYYHTGYTGLVCPGQPLSFLCPVSSPLCTVTFNSFFLVYPLTMYTICSSIPNRSCHHDVNSSSLTPPAPVRDILCLFCPTRTQQPAAYVYSRMRFAVLVSEFVVRTVVPYPTATSCRRISL